MKNINFKSININHGFWEQKQKLNRSVTIHSVYNRFKDTGRIDAFKCDWKNGSDNKPHFFWDSDVAKWIESVAYLTETEPEPELEKAADEIIDRIEANQCRDGYFNIYYTVVEPGTRFKDRSMHELYCAGHLIEAAVAYFEATGKDKLLKCMIKYANYIEKVFMIEKSAAFATPGHEELELALVRLFNITKDKRYLMLSEYFINSRGKGINGESDDIEIQAHKPVREQKTAEGHSVRAMYLYCGMADIAYKMQDEELKTACKRLFQNIVNQRMYITGGVGSSSNGERFTIDYDLPNATAYAESCAAIGLVYFAWRMQLLDNNSIYADTIERVIYNGFLSSISLDGKSFFYENPLEIMPSESKSFSVRYPITQRMEVFSCSCCPPNITRFIASIGNYVYSVDGNTIYCNQFINSTANIEINGKTSVIQQITEYPNDGKIRIVYNGNPAVIAVRVPYWCDDFNEKCVNGYVYYNVTDGSKILIDFNMKIKFIEANPRVIENCGKYAIMYGPTVYCMEAVDNGEYLRDIRIVENGSFKTEFDNELKALVIYADAYKHKISNSVALYAPKSNNLIPFKAKLIPYYTFANRGESEMLVWAQLC